MAQGLGSQQCPGSENSLMPFTCPKITFCMRCLGLLFPPHTLLVVIEGLPWE